MPNYQIKLPDIYEQYLYHLKHTRAVSEGLLKGVRRVLAFFCKYTKTNNIRLLQFNLFQQFVFGLLSYDNRTVVPSRLKHSGNRANP